MSNSNKKILLVEDDPDLLFLMKKKLTDEHIFEVITAETGQQALELINSQPPDLILLDILLPDIDGMTILNDISSRPETKNIPVIILSNLADQGAFEQVAAIGHYEYLIKAKTELQEVVKKIKIRLNIN
ncbi:MAG: hypothetical protein A2744_04320 [Candidatus Buchananbacteria bacterium RIFCSPHIGHO2_01_FULL_44_11]|uniref:Response regulatory domain-containing protein n=1 Tax=Candidatus Buchananbacteria bacterium RIFCSPHIGHO2_01_FULL_44_11 TaxID=1797535 RepID=A0A1G1XZK7_9BACT|nr:MAG: hypothetical protein A2744_04320 [Candidatus Buchananbacteria bacterium RIFCSPHIGHO2_01_FULL_44_11]